MCRVHGSTLISVRRPFSFIESETSMFCTDIDLLRWEPHIASEAAFSTQTLLSTTGSVSGTTLTIAAGSLAASRIRAGFIACLSGTINGSFPIVSVDTSTACTLSVVYDGLDEAPPLPVSPGAATDLAVAIRSFFPQRKIISDLLSRMAGVEPGGDETILNPEEFRKPCVLGTLHMIYSAMSTASFENRADLLIRAELYERLYRKSLRGVSAVIDTNGDGIANRRQPLRVIHFARV
jgi:hypothetical protein